MADNHRRQSSSKQPGGKKSAIRISPSRAAAFQILLELSRSSSAHSDDLLQGERIDRLSAQDRNLCITLTMGVLRWQLLLDAQITNALTHKSKLDEPIRIALRLGLFQLLFLDRVPAHAVLSESVELAKKAGHTFASGLVNAVLRRFVAHADSLKSAIDPRNAHPPWLIERWSNFFGAAATAAICSHDQYPPSVTVRLATGHAEAAVIDEGVELAPGVLLRDARALLAGDVANSIAVRDGLVRMQDEGSQLVAEILGGGVREPANILDTCAAPGGKTAILAERHPLSRIVAMDVSAARVSRMQSLFKQTPAFSTIEIRVLDAAQMQAGSERFDLILCDVPCSGTGTLARNPEIKLRLRPKDLVRQQERQIAILRAALRVLASGGRLVYSTCSLEPEENEQVILAVMHDMPGIALIPVRDRVEELRLSGALHAEGAALLLANGISGDFLRLAPGKFSTDGFFAAILTRS